jgi:hypothetical protein
MTSNKSTNIIISSSAPKVHIHSQHGRMPFGKFLN